MNEFKLDNNSLIAVVATMFLLSLGGTCSVSEIAGAMKSPPPPAPPVPTEVLQLQQEVAFAKACGEACSREYLRFMDSKRGICECASDHPLDPTAFNPVAKSEPVVCPEVDPIECPEPVECAACPEIIEAIPFVGPPLLDY